jgi:ketosteroid isomerase-like protein
VCDSTHGAAAHGGALRWRLAHLRAQHGARAAELRGVRAAREAFEDFHVQVEEHHEAGDELVVFVRYSGRGRASGAWVDAELAHVWTFKDGIPIRLRQFLDRAAALEAAGL